MKHLTKSNMLNSKTRIAKLLTLSKRSCSIPWGKHDRTLRWAERILCILFSPSPYF